jgi:hypothetical protein
MVKMKNISFIVILLFSSIIYAQENSKMNVVFKINIDFNGKPDLNKKYDMLVINYSDEQIDRYDSITTGTKLKLRASEIYEVRLKSSDQESTINRFLIHTSDISDINKNVTVIDVNIKNKSKFTSNDINEGTMFYNKKNKRWEIFDNSEIQF